MGTEEGTFLDEHWVLYGNQFDDKFHILKKEKENIQQKKDTLFSKWCWENWATTCRRVKLDHFLTIHKNKLKMNERPKCEAGNHQNPRG